MSENLLGDYWVLDTLEHLFEVDGDETQGGGGEGDLVDPGGLLG